MARHPHNHEQIAEAIGMEAALKLCAEFGGEAIYIPRIDNIARCKHAAEIIRKYNGYNAKKLAKEYNLTIRRIQQIVQGVDAQLEGQVGMDILNNYEEEDAGTQVTPAQ